MIKKSIGYTQKLVNDILADNDLINDHAEGAGYDQGSKDVAEGVRDGLDALEILYSIYELNPYAPGSDKWEEVAVTRDPDSSKHIAEALSRSHSGQIDIRYEYKENLVFEVKKVGDAYRSLFVGKGER